MSLFGAKKVKCAQDKASRGLSMSREPPARLFPDGMLSLLKWLFVCCFVFLACGKLCFLHAALQVSPDVTAFLSVSLFFLSAPFLANLFSVKAWISQTLTAARRKGIGRLRSSNLLRLLVASPPFCSRLPSTHPPVSFSGMLTFFFTSHPSRRHVLFLVL